MKRLSVFALVATVVSLCLPLAARASEPPSVIISEINWYGSSLSTADEWIELTNLTDNSIDVSNWQLTGAGSGGTALVLPVGSVIESYSAFLISNYASDNQKTTLAIEPDFVTTAVSLSNSGVRIGLLDASGAEIDVCGDGGAPFAGGPAGNGVSPNGGIASLVRVTSSDGALPESWAASTLSIGFDDSEMQTGTPGRVEEWFASSVEDPPVEDVTEIEPAPIDEPAIENPPADEPVIQIVPEDPPAEVLVAPEPAPVVATETQVPATEIEPADTLSETPEPTLLYMPGSLLITELVSDPVSGQEEWVEIYNATGVEIPLEGWTIREGSGSSTALPDQTLASGDFIVVENINGNLNNDGDTVQLLDPTGAIIDEMTYGTGDVPIASDPDSLSRTNDGSWVVTSPTPGAVNVIEVAVTAAPAANEEPASESERITVAPVDNPETSVSVDVSESEYFVVDSQAAEDVVPAIADGPTTIRFSELLPDPTGDDATDEFIELENFGDATVDLDGWSIEDVVGKRYTWNTPTVVSPHDLLVLGRPQSNLTLNNDGDALTLFAPDGAAIDSVSYENAKPGSAFARIDRAWLWTTLPSPAEPNRVPPPQPQASAVAATVSKTTARTSARGSGVRAVSILQAQALADDAKVRVQGVVTSLPGMFGTQIFYLQDDTAGIQIYKYDAVFPTLALGDEIQIEGTLSTIRGERRIKVSSASAIVVTGHDEARQPVELKAEELDASHVGSLVAAAGLIVERSGNDLTLEDNGAQTIIRLMDGTKLDPMRYAPGNHLRAVGVLSTSNGTLRVLPRDETDLVITEMPPPVPGEQTGKAQQTQQSQSTATTIVLVALAGLLALAARHYFPKLKAHYAKNLALRPAAQKPH